MKKRMCDGWYRRVRTTQERRQSLIDKKYVRASRNFRNLPNTYDDINNKSYGMRKSWKTKREKQYYVGGRGKKYSFYIPREKEDFAFRRNYNSLVWKLEEFFKEHDIPFFIEEDKECHTSIHYIYTYRRVINGGRLYPTYYDFRDDRPPKLMGYYPRYEDVPYDPPKEVKYTYTTIKGYTITYWSKKDIAKALTFLGVGV